MRLKSLKQRKLSEKRRDWMVAARKRSHGICDLPDTIVDAVRVARMSKRHNHLDKLITRS
jgi:hypothetical protein